MSFRQILSVVLSLAILVLFIGLGTWQVQRLQWKESVLAEIEAHIAADPVPLPASPDELRDKYLPVEVAGSIGDKTLRVLVSTKEAGAGYRLISPLSTDTGTVMMDRGFIRVDQPIPSTPHGTVIVTGNLHWPDDRGSATPENDVSGNTWFARDIPQMAEVLGSAPALIIARQINPPETGVKPLPVTTEGIPNRHLEYAGTWFLLALTWSVMTLTLLWRKKRRKS